MDTPTCPAKPFSISVVRSGWVREKHTTTRATEYLRHSSGRSSSSPSTSLRPSGLSSTNPTKFTLEWARRWLATVWASFPVPTTMTGTEATVPRLNNPKATTRASGTAITATRHMAATLPTVRAARSEFFLVA